MNESFAADIDSTRRMLEAIDKRPATLNMKEFEFIKAFVARHAASYDEAPPCEHNMAAKSSRSDRGDARASEVSSQSDDEAPPPLAVFDGGVTQLTEELKNYPPSCRAYVKRGSLHLDQGSHEAALADASAALKLNPDSAAAFRLRSRARHVLKDNEGAYKDMSAAQAIDYDSDSAALHAQMKLDLQHADALRKKEASAVPQGNPLDLATLLSNPGLVHMAQTMMSNPKFMTGVFADLQTPRPA